MSHRNRSVAAALVLVASAAALTSCSLFGPTGPPRGEDGQVTESAVVPTTELLTGDCFSFVDEYPNHERVDLVPCADEHGYIVIAQGELTASAIDDAGGLQNAVSANCSEPFATFKAAAAEGTKPTQEFLVTESTVEGSTLTNYSCVATDGAVSASE
jgi:hypothetical protein